MIFALIKNLNVMLFHRKLIVIRDSQPEIPH